MISFGSREADAHSPPTPIKRGLNPHVVGDALGTKIQQRPFNFSLKETTTTSAPGARLEHSKMWRLHFTEWQL